MNLACVRLQQHLSDSGCRSEVAIDLKWRMSVEQVCVYPTSAVISNVFYENWCQRFPQKQIGMIAFEHSCPKIDLPRQTPPGANVAAHFQALFRRREQLGRFTGRDLVARVYTIK